MPGARTIGSQELIKEGSRLAGAPLPLFAARPDTPHSERAAGRGIHYRWWLIPLLLVTFWLGARSLGADTVWIDELHSIEDAGGPTTGPLTLRQIWVRVATTNPWHTPAYFMLLSGWGRLVGWEPAALRALSLLLGLLTVAWVYRLGTDFHSSRVGVLAAAVLGTSAFFAHFLHEMRVYTLYTALTAATLWLYFRLANPKRTPHRSEWLSLLMIVTAMLYTHYFAMLPLAAMGLYHLLAVPKTRRWWQIAGVAALGGALFLPWVGALITGLQWTAAQEDLHARALTAADAVERLAYFFGNGAPWLLLPLLLLALLTRGRGARAVVLITLALLTLLLVTNEVLRLMHGGRLRYLIALWPLLALAVAFGIAQLRRWPALMLSVVAVWIAPGLWNTVVSDITAGLDGSLYVFPYHRIAAALDDRAIPGDVIVNMVPDDGLDAIRYEKIAHYYYSRIGLEYLVTQIAPTTEGERQFADLRNLLSRRERVWLAHMPDHPPAALERLRTALDAEFTRCDGTIAVPSATIELYARSPGLCSVGTA